MQEDKFELRINKYIGELGICSRREADRIIDQGRVTVNGKPAEKGTKISPEDEVRLDGKIINKKKPKVYIALYKPVGITCTTEKRVLSNITDYVNYPERIFPIGRLDKDSEGLILLTNDGDIVNKILRAKNNHEKEYIVSVNEKVDNEFIKKMSSGVHILDTVTKPCKVYKISDYVFKIILTQGLNRQIRRMCKECGRHVTNLKRIRILNIELGSLPYGKWRYLSPLELNELNTLLKDSISTQEGSV